MLGVFYPAAGSGSRGILLANTVLRGGKSGRLRPGSVIVDLAAAGGGNCPLTVADQVVERHGVTIVGHTNYPSMVAADASAFYAKNLLNLIEIMVDKGEAGPVLKDLSKDDITQAMLG